MCNVGQHYVFIRTVCSTKSPSRRTGFRLNQTPNFAGLASYVACNM
jgi:hypothetical protein